MLVWSNLNSEYTANYVDIFYQSGMYSCYTLSIDLTVSEQAHADGVRLLRRRPSSHLCTLWSGVIVMRRPLLTPQNVCDPSINSTFDPSPNNIMVSTHHHLELLRGMQRQFLS